MIWFLVTLSVGCLLPEMSAETCSGGRDAYGNSQGTFFCPRLFEDDDNKYCCDNRGQKYCCDRRAIFGPGLTIPDSIFWSLWKILLIAGAVLVAVVIVAVVLCCLCCAACPGNRRQGRVLRGPGIPVNASATMMTTSTYPQSTVQQHPYTTYQPLSTYPPAQEAMPMQYPPQPGFIYPPQQSNYAPPPYEEAVK